MKFVSFQKTNSKEILERIQNLIKERECRHIGIDISNLNIFDASKILLLSSAIHFTKYPDGKIKYKVKSKEIENLITGFSTKNLEIV